MSPAGALLVRTLKLVAFAGFVGIGLIVAIAMAVATLTAGRK